MRQYKQVLAVPTDGMLSQGIRMHLSHGTAYSNNVFLYIVSTLFQTIVSFCCIFRLFVFLLLYSTLF